jgi:ribose 5-phosphate isomerase B
VIAPNVTLSLPAPPLNVRADEDSAVTRTEPVDAVASTVTTVAKLVAEKVVINEDFVGILICGSGVGMCITANKTRGVRAGVCWDVEIAELMRLHNDANIICLPARFISIDDAIDSVNTFLFTPFEGGRHEDRVKTIEKI